MRLIDADELKKCAIPCKIHNGALTDLCVPLYQIDNAPTVEITEEQAIDKLHETGWLPRHDKEMTARPQGEWKLHGMIYYCSVCGHDYEQGGNNFCGNCGADMRGDCDNPPMEYFENGGI